MLPEPAEPQISRVDIGYSGLDEPGLDKQRPVIQTAEVSSPARPHFLTS